MMKQEDAREEMGEALMGKDGGQAGGRWREEIWGGKPDMMGGGLRAGPLTD